MPSHYMHGKCFTRWTDCNAITALSTTTVDMLCFNVMFHMVPPQRCKAARQALPLTTFQFLHTCLDHLIQVCTDEMKWLHILLTDFSLFNFNSISNAFL